MNNSGAYAPALSGRQDLSGRYGAHTAEVFSEDLARDFGAEGRDEDLAGLRDVREVFKGLPRSLFRGLDLGDRRGLDQVLGFLQGGSVLPYSDGPSLEIRLVQGSDGFCCSLHGLEFDHPVHGNGLSDTVPTQKWELKKNRKMVNFPRFSASFRSFIQKFKYAIWNLQPSSSQWNSLRSLSSVE